MDLTQYRDAIQLNLIELCLKLPDTFKYPIELSALIAIRTWSQGFLSFVFMKSRPIEIYFEKGSFKPSTDLSQQKFNGIKEQINTFFRVLLTRAVSKEMFADITKLISRETSESPYMDYFRLFYDNNTKMTLKPIVEIMIPCANGETVDSDSLNIKEEIRCLRSQYGEIVDAAFAVTFTLNENLLGKVLTKFGFESNVTLDEITFYLKETLKESKKTNLLLKTLKTKKIHHL